MNYACDYMMVKANWFDHNLPDNKRKIKQIGFEAFYLYITLFRFRVMNQESLYTFITSVDALRKEMNESGEYTGEKIVELLKILEKYKIIDVENLSRWDYLYKKDENKNISSIDVHKLLRIVATDLPDVRNEFDPVAQRNKRVPLTAKDLYIDIDLKVFDHYDKVKLKRFEKYFPLYCLLRKLSNGNPEKKSWMKIQNMADVLGYDKNTLNKMIFELNRHCLLYSHKRKNPKGNFYFEHHLMRTMKWYDHFTSIYKDKTERLVSRWDKKQEKIKAKRKLKKGEEIDEQEMDELFEAEESDESVSESDNQNENNELDFLDEDAIYYKKFSGYDHDSLPFA